MIALGDRRQHDPVVRVRLDDRLAVLVDLVHAVELLIALQSAGESPRRARCDVAVSPSLAA